MKKLIRIALVLVVLVIAAVVSIALSLDSTIKKGVETIGPRITKVDVKISSVSLSLLSGSGSIKGLVIGNPEGYQTPYAMSVGSASLVVSPGSLLSDKIVVKSIRVEAPEISFELGVSGSNLQKIQANLSSGAATKEASSEPAAEKGPGKKLQVDEVIITGGKITLAATMLGGKLTEAPLPEIRLSGLGTGPDGITGAVLGEKILTAIMDGAISVSGDALKKSGQEAIDNATKAATDKVTKGIGDLLNKKKP